MDGLIRNPGQERILSNFLTILLRLGMKQSKRPAGRPHEDA
jgi:hypothetical protein